MLPRWYLEHDDLLRWRTESKKRLSWFLPAPECTSPFVRASPWALLHDRIIPAWNLEETQALRLSLACALKAEFLRLIFAAGLHGLHRVILAPHVFIIYYFVIFLRVSYIHTMYFGHIHPYFPLTPLDSPSTLHPLTTLC